MNTTLRCPRAQNQPPPLTSEQLDDLARAAQQRGYTTPQQVMRRMESMMRSNQSYLDYRKRTGRETPYDARAQGDTEVLALAHEMLAQAYGTEE